MRRGGRGLGGGGGGKEKSLEGFLVICLLLKREINFLSTALVTNAAGHASNFRKIQKQQKTITLID